MKKIALVTDTDQPQINVGDRLVLPWFEKAGLRVVGEAWDNPGVSWENYEAIILRSCWNYPEKYQEFGRWLNRIQKLPIKIWNPPETVKFNIHKSYLSELKNRGIAIIPTLFVAQNSLTTVIARQLEQVEWPELVVKPAIGNSAKKVKVFNQKEKAFEYVVGVNEDVLIQKLIDKTTEISLIFFNQQFSHAVKKYPKPYLDDVPGEMVIQAKKILKLIPGPWLYARVDLVTEAGVIEMMELELTEPYLYLEMTKTAPEAFVRAYLTLNRN